MKRILFYERNEWFDQAAVMAKIHGYYEKACELCRAAFDIYARAGPKWIKNALDLAKRVMTRKDRKEFKEKLRLEGRID